MEKVAMENISLYPNSELAYRFRVPARHEGRFASRHETRAGMRWTQLRRRDAEVAGRAFGLVSDHPHADERRNARTAKPCGPDARSWRQVLAVMCFSQPGRRISDRQGDGGNRARLTGATTA